MDEKASHKERGGEADWRTGVPDLPPGEELALEPVGDDEIDPLPKWWDESPAAEEDKTANRRLEETGESEPPRRERRGRADSEGPEEADPIAEELEEIPAEAAPDPLEAMAESAEAEPATDPGPLGLPEIDLGTIKVKHQRKSDEGEFEALFGEGDREGEEEDAAPAGTAEEAAEPSPEATQDAPPSDGEAARDPGPPSLPADLGFEIKPPLIPGVDESVRPKAPAKAEAPPAAEPARRPEPPTPSESAAAEEGAVEETTGEELAPLPEDDERPEAPAPEGGSESESASEPSPEPAAAAAEPGEAPGSSEDAAAESESVAPLPSESAPAPVPTVIGDPLPAKAESGPAPAKRKAGCWTIFATVFFVAAMLVLVLLVGAAFFAWSRVGRFEEEVKALAETKLKERGIHLDYGAWRYEFPRGLVVDEVTLYEDEARARPVAKASAFGVNVDFLSLAKNPGEFGAVEISLGESQVTLYEKGEVLLEIGDVDAEILADASSVVVERFAGTVGSLQLRLDGGVLLADQSEASGGAAEGAVGEGAKRSALANLDLSKLHPILPWLDFEKGEEGKALLAASFLAEADGGAAPSIEGSFEGAGIQWRGLEFARLFASFRSNPTTGELHIPSLQADCGGGSAAAALVVDTAGRVVRIERLQSTADPVAMLSAYDPAWAETFRSLRLVDAPSIQLTGTVPFDEPANAALEIVYSHRHGLVHLQGERELPLSDLRGRLRYGRGILETNDVALRLFGGEATVNGALDLQREGRPFNGLVEISGVSLEEAADWFGDDGRGLAGRLDLTFRGTGSGGIANFNGGGNLRIEEAALPNFPVLGPVQGLLGKVVPAFGAKPSGTVSGAYILESGVLVTSDLAVRNDGARVAVNGSLNLASKQTHFTATASLEPALAAATGLKDKAVVVEGAGPWREPDLKIREFPVEFAAAGLGEVLGTTPESLGGLKDLLGSEDPAAALTGSLEEATGLKLDPAVTDLLRGILGGGEARPEPEPERPILRAIPQEN